MSCAAHASWHRECWPWSSIPSKRNREVRPGRPEAPPSGTQVELAWGDQTAVVVGVGGGVRAVRAADHDVLDGYRQDEMCPAAHGQALIPWPNRIRDGRYSFGGRTHQLALSEPQRHNAIHGLTRWMPWDVLERSPEQAAMGCELFPNPGYPFHLLLENRYRLGRHGLSVSTTAVNVGPEPCPYGCGFHPYLTLATDRIDSVLLRLPAQNWFTVDEGMIPAERTHVAGTELDFRQARPVGPTVIDNTFAELERDAEGRAWVELSDPAGGRRLRLWVDSGYSYLQVFTGDSLGADRRRRSLAVEPMTCAPNAFQSGEGLVSLQPGESHTCSWGIVAT